MQNSNKNKIKNEENPQIQVHFVTKHKLQSQYQQQQQLHLEMLRLLGSQKSQTIAPIFTMSQSQLCQFFLQYELLPDTPFTMDELKESERVKLIRNKGKVYFGEVRDRQMDGFGICYYQEGKVYEGVFGGNRREGRGCEVYADGNIYVGEFVNNKKHGNGQFFWFKTGEEGANSKVAEFFQFCEGEWWGGLPDGKVTMQKANGDLYEGTFKNGLKHGFGHQKFSNGDTYKGQYINGLPQGIGQYNWQDGSYYKGDFKQGLRSGYGLWKMNNKNNQKSDRYEGHYCMDKKSGYGEYVWENGWVYKGNFQQDLRDGYGELFNRDQLVFRGQWRKGQKILPQQPNNVVKLSRLELKIQLATKENQIQVQDICESINRRPVKLSGFCQHELLARPGFLIRKSRAIPNTSRQREYPLKKQKNTLIESQSTLTSRIGTEIHRPISKISLGSSRNLKSSHINKN